jgi:uncharacterized membrane protein YhhN
VKEREAVSPVIVPVIAATARRAAAPVSRLAPGVWFRSLSPPPDSSPSPSRRALETPYGQAVLAALVLCWAGDVFLIRKGAGAFFLVGLVSFLLGHVGFAVAFVLCGPDPIWMAAAALLALPPALIVLRWLHPHLSARMRAPVVAYVVVMSLVVVTAAGAAAATGRGAIALGAGCFYLSDLHVARDRFDSRSFWNKSSGLPLYYAAQLILATTVSL